jgi:hypothetical protein
MMAIEHVNRPGPHIRDTVGAARDVLIWGYGTTKGRVAAVQLLTDGSADVVIEWEQPEPVTVPDVGTRQAWMSGE